MVNTNEPSDIYFYTAGSVEIGQSRNSEKIVVTGSPITETVIEYYRNGELTDPGHRTLKERLNFALHQVNSDFIQFEGLADIKPSAFYAGMTNQDRDGFTNELSVMELEVHGSVNTLANEQGLRLTDGQILDKGEQIDLRANNVELISGVNPSYRMDSEGGRLEIYWNRRGLKQLFILKRSPAQSSSSEWMEMAAEYFVNGRRQIYDSYSEAVVLQIIGQLLNGANWTSISGQVCCPNDMSGQRTRVYSGTLP